MQKKSYWIVLILHKLKYNKNDLKDINKLKIIDKYMLLKTFFKNLRLYLINRV
jgi:hypothetical protein